MKLTKLGIAGPMLLEPEMHRDRRGFFARAWCARELGEAGIDVSFVQASLSFTIAAGSVRGLHYQRPPSTEAKLVRCTSGSIVDVIVDIRPDSKTFLAYEAVELSVQNRNALYIPSGFAHGFQTTSDDVELYYEMTDFHQPDLAAGIRYDDPAIGIAWPVPVSVINDRDANLPDLKRENFDVFRGIAVS